MNMDKDKDNSTCIRSEDSYDSEDSYHSATSESPNYSSITPVSFVVLYTAVSYIACREIIRSRHRFDVALGLPSLPLKKKNRKLVEDSGAEGTGSLADFDDVSSSHPIEKSQLNGPGMENLSKFESFLMEDVLINRRPELRKRRVRDTINSSEVVLTDTEIRNSSRNGCLSDVKNNHLEFNGRCDSEILDIHDAEIHPEDGNCAAAMSINEDESQIDMLETEMDAERCGESVLPQPQLLNTDGSPESLQGLLEQSSQEGSVSSVDVNSSVSSILQQEIEHIDVDGSSSNDVIDRFALVGEDHDNPGVNIRFVEDSLEAKGADSDQQRNSGQPAYRIPDENQSTNLLLWPATLAVKTISFQFALIVQAFSAVGSVFGWCNSFASNRVNDTLEARDMAKEVINHKVSMITNVPPKFAESGSALMKKTAWGCLAAAYVCILLSMLVLPALFLDLAFWSKVVEEPMFVREPLHFDYTMQHPAAVIPLHPGHAQSSKGKLAFHSEHLRPIPVSHKVQVTVFLTLPESDYNRNLGMFQLTAELLSDNGQTIKSSSRPCMLRFYSEPIRWVKSLMFGLPSLVGLFSESQTLEIRLMEFEEQPSPTGAVKIIMQPKAGMPLGHGIPEIYFANIVIQSKLPWLKGLVRSWKWTFYIWTGLMLYVMEIMIVLCCCRRALLPKQWVNETPNGNSEQIYQANPDISQAVLNQRLSKRQIPNRHRVSFDERIQKDKAMSSAAVRKLRQDIPDGNR